MARKAARPISETSAISPEFAFREHWPKAFLSWRAALLWIAGYLVLSALLVTSADNGSLAGVKPALSAMLALPNPDLIDPQCWDLAIVLLGCGFVGVAGVIHVSLGLASLLLFRPWIDGYTYPADNFYFLWGTVLLALIWAVRAWRNRQSFDYGVSAGLLLGFLATLVISTYYSVCFDQSHRALTQWVSYAVLFIVAANALRSRASVAVVLGGLLLSAAFEAGFSILHYQFLLPYLRKLIQDPAYFRQYFDALTPELARRFNFNRAFGSMLFPNTLSAFLILAIPCSLTSLLSGLHWTRGAWTPNLGRPGSSGTPGRRYRAVALAVAAWFFLLSILFLSMQFPIACRGKEEPLPWYLATSVVFSGAAGFSLLPAIGLYLTARRKGISAALWLGWTCFMAVALAAEFEALWLTLSRGAMLALAVSLALAGCLYVMNRKRSKPHSGRILKQAVWIGLFIAAGAALGAALEQNAAQAQQEAAPSGPDAATPRTPGSLAITESGYDPTWEDFKNLRSASLRFSYWKVGLKMALHHSGWGVGLRNFGTMYPRYQYFGAGDVREAHHGYLQLWCETGLLGALLWLGFCVSILIAGARRILREPDPWRRLEFAGWWGGLAAFLAHAGVDINFSHPSLMMIFMTAAGAFLSAARLEETPAAKLPEVENGDEEAAPPLPAFWKAALGPALTLAIGLAAIISGGRFYLQDLCSSRIAFNHSDTETPMKRHIEFATLFVRENVKYGMDRSLRKPQFRLPDMMEMLGSLDAVKKVGQLFIPDETGRTARPIREGESPGPDAIVVITYPWDALKVLRQQAQYWTERMAAIDARYPHNYKIAMFLAEWNHRFAMDTLSEKLKPLRQEYMDQYLYWSEQALRRNSFHPDVILSYGNALFFLGKNDDRRDIVEYSQRAADSVKQALDASPLSVRIGLYYADVLHSLATLYREKGQASQGDAVEAQSKEVRTTYETLQKQYQALGAA